eukprot:2258758-Prymnesium_polylepis.2
MVPCKCSTAAGPAPPAGGLASRCRRPHRCACTAPTVYTLMRHARPDRCTGRDAACGGGRGDAARAPSSGDEAAGDVPHGLAATVGVTARRRTLTLAPRLPQAQPKRTSTDVIARPCARLAVDAPAFT